MMRSGKILKVFMLAMGLAFALPLWAQQKPLTRDQVQSLVRSGLGDESGAKMVEQRGLDFVPTADFLQSLQAAGASERFLQALRAAKVPESESAKKPLDQVQVFALLAGQIPSHRVAMLVKERGIDFDAKDDYLREVILGGGDEELISALKSAKVTKPRTVDPGAEARQAEVLKHAARGAELFQKYQDADAEVEYRAAIRLDPQNADLHVALSRALNGQHKTDESIAEAREALRLNPESDQGHFSLGYALGLKGDGDGSMAEFREALRLNPNNYAMHIDLGSALEIKGDMDGATKEFREAVRENPNKDTPHYGLATALAGAGDMEGAMAEYRQALRLNPSSAEAHNNLGVVLEKKGDLAGALEEYRRASTLAPQNALFKQNLRSLGAACE